jgi:hypothetical protein
MRIKLALPILLFALALHGAFLTEKPKENPTEKDLVNYIVSKAAAYNDFLKFHNDAKWQLEQGHLCVISWFVKDESRVAIICAVTNEGKASVLRNVYKWSTKNQKDFRMDEKKFEELKENIKKMPKENIPKTRTNLLVVSYRIGLRWFVKQYDKTSIPPEVKKILDEFGEKAE